MGGANPTQTRINSTVLFTHTSLPPLFCELGRCSYTHVGWCDAGTGLLALAHQQYNSGRYKDAHITCEQIYQTDAYRTDNLLLLGAIHFQLRNFSECIFYNQQAIRIDPNFAEA